MKPIWAALFCVLGTAAHAGCGHSGLAETTQTVEGGPEAFLLQDSLVALGYLNGPVDGAIGPATRAGVAALQDDAGLDPSGVADPATLEAIYALGQRRDIAVRFAPDPTAGHEWPAFTARLIADEGGRCDLLLEGPACPAERMAVTFASSAHPPARSYKNTGCRFSQDARGEAVFQHLGNELVVLWAEQSGYAYPENTTLIGVSPDCAQQFLPDHAAQDVQVTLLDTLRFDERSGFETKLFAAQYEDILTQADRMDLISQVHGNDRYSLSRLHRWSDQADCE